MIRQALNRSDALGGYGHERSETFALDLNGQKIATGCAEIKIVLIVLRKVHTNVFTHHHSEVDLFSFE